VWEWFSTIEGHYLDWHPEHIEWRNIKGLPTKVGSTVFFDEWLGWFRLPMRCKIPEVRVGRYWRYEGTFPWSVVRAGGSFELVPVGEESDLVAEVHLGWPVPVLGPIVDFAIHAIFPKHHLRRHMTEEGHNLAAILSDSGFEAHQIWESSDA
jgi:hypothetical protein